MRTFCSIIIIEGARKIGICLAEPKAGDYMTGKFKNSNNGICLAYCIIAPFVVFIGTAVVVVSTGINELKVIIWVLAIAAMILPIFPLKKCAFSADDEKVVFRVVFLKHTYCYSEIHSASTQTGFSHGRYGSSARVELVISLSDGERLTFYDENVPDDALSTPENHKFFQDTHQFTALCKFINERAKG